MKKYDIIIIGCGLSCLYFLKKIKESNRALKIAVLEKKPFAGGRIRSEKIGNDIIDTGALRFNDNHKLLISLLKEYNINDIEELVSKKNIKLSPALEKRFRDFLKEHCKSKYDRFSFGEIAKVYFDEKEYSKLKLWFGYDQKWEESNCQSLCLAINNYEAKKYYHLKNGLSQLVDALLNDVKDNFDINFGEKVMKISDGNNIYTMSNNHYVCDHIIFACPPHYIGNIQGTQELVPILSSIEGQILNRIYAKFKDGNWFPKNVLHSYKPIGQTVPINDNIIMISYSTGKDAKYWIEKEMSGELWKGISEELGVKEKPIWIKQNYWNPGTHFYKPGFNMQEVENLSFKPLNHKNWSIIGEAYSEQQGWMEGALQNTSKFIKKYFADKLQMNLKSFTLKEVEKHNKDGDAWMAISGNVYDVSSWIDIHPGGAVIKYGIGKDATDMFKNAGHNEDALEFMNHYKIGILK